MKERREKEEERKQDGTCLPGRELGRGSCIGKPPHCRKISWERRGALGARRRAQQPVCGRQDRLRPTQMVCATALHATAWDMCPPVHMGAGGWNVGFGEQTQGETAVGCEETAWEVGSEELCKWECLWRKHRPPQKQSAIVEWHAEGWATIAASLLTRWPLPPWALGRAHTRAGLRAPAIASLPPNLAWAARSPWSPNDMFNRYPAPSYLGGLLAVITASAPSCLMGLCALATSGADSGGRNTHRGGAETTAEPQEPCD